MSPTVSVILCTYQQGKYLPHAINSVVAQTYQDFELLIIDNGSTDGSDEIIMAAAEKDPRIDYTLYVENGPVTQRLNAAVRQSTGRYLAFLYGDDYYLPNHLARMVHFAESQSSCADMGIFHGSGYREWPDGTRRWAHNFYSGGSWTPSFLPLLLSANFDEGPVNAISPLMRREVLEQYPFYDDIFVEGESMFLKYALTWKFYWVGGEPTVVMREHDANMGKAVALNTRIAVQCLDRLVTQPAFKEKWLPDVQRFRGELLARGAWLALRMLCDPQAASEFGAGALKAGNRSWRAVAGLLGGLCPPSWLHHLNALRPAPEGKASWS